jgi:hypothetical protein
MSKTKPSPADAGLSTLLKAAQTIIANHERDDGYGAALGEVDESVADPVERAYKLQDAGVSAQKVAAYLLARGGRELIEGRPSGWSDVRNGCLAHYLAMKTALDLRSRNAQGPVDLRDCGFRITYALFCAGAASLFPDAVSRQDALRWCQLDTAEYKPEFKEDVWPDIETQFRLAVIAVRLAEEPDFESSIDREMSELQGRLFSVRTYLATAVDRHVRYAAEGIKRKQGDFDALPVYCIFPAHLVALARKVVTPAAPPGHSLLTAAHLTPLPADAMRLNPTLDRLRAAVRESGVFLQDTQ